MKVKEITVNRGFTIKLDNYEFARLDASITMVLDEKDDPEQVYQAASDFVDQRLSEDMDALNDEK